ncbi:hypothetical protein Desru_1921 [Desulforamulus ruminis DSM 2154]|uniref:Uncharacterized protein n=1 Tax=Desulforamulus ruminis (strain ATCC 23193 / DSM 2154 / NCIMB 8452 / DL) TaxID=696281 RepID=F6DUP2_DESRL|nr:hypothetical protein Desru_1921 [Desulforamulus ruminis DSM 2154]
MKKLVIDTEQKDGATAYCVHTESGETIEVVLAGKRIISVPVSEQADRIYRLLEENCDLIFCTTQKPNDFPFYPIPQFFIFAVDSKENCFGTIGGMGDIADDDFPVGYVNRKGEFGIITTDFKEFLSLVTFYPCWRDIIRCERTGAIYNIEDMKMSKIENHSQYLARQSQIVETLKLSKNPKSLELLISNIKSPSDFMVYASKEEAEKVNTFLDISNLI